MRTTQQKLSGRTRDSHRFSGCHSFLLVLLAGILTGCGEDPAPARDSEQKSATSIASPPSTVLAGVLAKAPSGTPMDIHAAKATAKPGDALTIKGEIMGQESPFVDGRAMFILGDPTVLTPCNRSPGDTCTTPWDACCDSPEDKKRATATVQVLDSENRVLKESIEGIGGVNKLASVVVSGVVAPQSTTDLLIINATSIQVR